jgi:putative thioredoxin
MNDAAVHDVKDDDFATAVFERSRSVPVVVDFWAPWCGPCRQIGPVLERLASEAAGQWELVKLNVDENPRTAGAFRIRSIPAVKAFRDGKVVTEFVGAIPEAQIRSWITRILPTEADRLADEGAARAKAGQVAEAEESYQKALAEDRDHLPAIVGLAEILGAKGEVDEAIALLDRRPTDAPSQALRAKLGLTRGGGADVGALRARIAADPKDARARYDLGRALAAKGEYEPALEELLEVVALDRKIDDDGARKAMLDVFRMLGDDDERTRSYRRRLSLVI